MKAIPEKIAAKEAGLARYFTGKPCIHGHVAERYTATGACIVCCAEGAQRRAPDYRDRAAELMRKQRKDHPERTKRQNDKRDPEMLRKIAKKYYWRNVERLRATASEYQAQQRAKDREAYNSARGVYQKRKRETDPQFKLAHTLRVRMRSLLVGKIKHGSAVKDLGCSILELVQHLEAQFRPPMSWANHGTVWEIDHIKPLSTFNLENREEFLEACHYTNLQPLPCKENRSKGGANRL